MKKKSNFNMPDGVEKHYDYAFWGEKGAHEDIFMKWLNENCTKADKVNPDDADCYFYKPHNNKLYSLSQLVGIFKNKLTDKQGTPIEVGNGKDIDDDILFDGTHYWRIYFARDGSIEMLGFGYKHNVTQETLSNFERVGKFKGNEHLLIVD